MHVVYLICSEGWGLLRRDGGIPKWFMCQDKECEFEYEDQGFLRVMKSIYLLRGQKMLASEWRKTWRGTHLKKKSWFKKLF